MSDIRIEVLRDRSIEQSSHQELAEIHNLIRIGHECSSLLELDSAFLGRWSGADWLDSLWPASGGDSLKASSTRHSVSRELCEVKVIG